MVNATFQVADAILLVAALSFLGLGIPPPAANWGGMLTNGINFIYSGYWWLIYPPGITIVSPSWASTSSATRCATPSRSGCGGGDGRQSPVLEVRDLQVDIALRRSTVHAVDGVSFVDRPGRDVGLVGESGCGKTTIGLALLRLLPTGGAIVGGSIRLEGRDVVGLRE